MRRALLLLAVVLATLSLSPRPALACDCMAPDPMDLIDSSEVVFIGALVAKQGRPQDMEVTYVFQVSEWVKSDLGSTVEVVSGPNGAACGWETPDPGAELGVAVRLDGDRLTGGLCSTLEAGVLAEAAAAYTPSGDAVPPLDPEAIGASPERESTASDTARIVFGLIIPAAVAGMAVSTSRRRRSPSIEEQ